MSASVHYVGFDVHKKMIACCVKTKGGKVRDEGTIRATRQSLSEWLTRRRQPRPGGGPWRPRCLPAGCMTTCRPTPKR